MAIDKRKIRRITEVADAVRRQATDGQQGGSSQQGALGRVKQQALNTLSQRSQYPRTGTTAGSSPAPAAALGRVTSALGRESNKAGGATQPAGFDMETYKRIVNNMLGNAAAGYTPEQEALMAATPGAVVQPLAKVAPHLYEQQAAWEAGGGVKPPLTYDDYFRKLVAAQGGVAAENMAIYDARVESGARPYTQAEIDAISDPRRAIAWEGEEPAAWDVWWNVNGAQDAINNAYAGQVNDMQYMMASGAFDNVRNLVNGNMPYVSTEYLNMMLEALPGMMEEQAAEHQGLIDRGFLEYVEGQRIVGNPALFDYFGNWYDPDSATPVEDFIDEYGDESALDHLETLIELDNIIFGSDMTVEDFIQLPTEQQGEAFRRMAQNYSDIIMGDDGAYSLMYEYPYDALMENIQAELDSRKLLAGYMDDVVANPNAWAFLEPNLNTVAHLTNADIGSPYYAVYYRNTEDTNWAMAPLRMMTAMEEAVFFYLANTEQTDQRRAREYLDALAPVLLVRARNADKLAWDYASTADWVGAVGSWVAARAANLALPVLTGAEMLGEMLSGEENVLPNALYDFSQTVTGAQERYLAQLGGPTFLGKNWQQWVYGTASNGADMAVAIAVGGALAPVLGMTPQAATLLLMSGQAGANEWNSLAGQGLETWDKVMRSVATAGIEALTEQIPIDTLFGKYGKGWRRVLLSAGSEGTEEMVSELAGYGLDWLVSLISGNQNKIQARLKELEQMGVQNPEEVVWGEVLTGTLAAGVGGTLLGGFMGGGTEMSDFMGDYSTGRRINKNNPSGVNTLMEFAGMMAEGSESRRLANTLKDKAESGKVSSRKVGELFRALVAETPGKYRREIEEMSVPAVVEALEDTYESLGMQMEDRYSPEEIARAILSTEGDADALKKTAIGKFIITHRGTKQVAEEFAKANAAWSKQLQERREMKNIEGIAAMGDIMNVMNKPEAETTDTAPTAETVTETIEDKDVEAITGRMTPHAGLPRAVVMPSEDGGSAEGSLVRVERSGDDLSLVVSQEGQEGETTVTLGEGVNVPDSGIAQVLAYAQQRRWISAGEINDMVNLALDTQLPAASVIAAYEAGVNAGFIGAAMPSVQTIAAKLSQEQADKVAEVISMGMAVGASTAANAESVRRAAAEKRSAMMQRGSGSVTYMGKFSTMEEATASKVRQKIKGVRSRLTEEQQAAVDALWQLSRVLGVNIVLYESTGEAGQANTMANGWYDQATRDIYIDLNSGVNTFGEGAVKYTILKTAAHELTHYIERGSAQGYAQLREAVREQLEARGENYMELVLNKVKNSRVLTDRVAAEAEVIADACEMMLTNTTAMTALASRHRGLAAKISQFIKGFKARVARAMTGNVATSPEASMLVNKAMQYADGLQQAWDRALIEAAGTVAEQPVVNKGTRVGAVTGTVKVVPAAVDVDTISDEAEAIAAEFENEEQGIAASALTQVASRLHTLNEAQLEDMVSEAVNQASDVFQVTKPSKAVKEAVLAHIRSIQATARAAVTQEMQTPMAEKKPAIIDDVASEATEEAVQTVEASGVTEIPAAAVGPIVEDIAEAAVEAGIQAAETPMEADAETDDAGMLYSERNLLEPMTEAARSAAEEAYVGTDEATRAMLAQVAEGVARVAEERVSWEVAVSEAERRQYSYAGRRSETMDEGLLNRAMARLHAGENAETIRQETGWFRGMDGKWRYEIDDSKAKLIRANLEEYNLLDDVFEHDELYAAYPFMRYIPVGVGRMAKGTHGIAAGMDITLSQEHVNTASDDELLNTLLHEIQHVIQDYENFASGSNMAYWSGRVSEALSESQLIDKDDAEYLEGRGLSEFVRKSMREVAEGAKDISQHFADLDAWKEKVHQERVQEFITKRIGGGNDGRIRRLNNEIRDLTEQQTEEMRTLMTAHDRVMHELETLGWDADDDADIRLMREADTIRKQADDIAPGIASQYSKLQAELRKLMSSNRPMNPYELYRQTAGEIEARDSADRASLNAEDRRNKPPMLDPDAVFVEGVQYSARRTDYQYTVEGARDFFGNNEVYHEFARNASDEIARHPKRKMHHITVTHYSDETFVCTVVKDGSRKYHLEDVAFIDTEGYNGRISELTTLYERVYRKYGQERIAKYVGSVVYDGGSRFRTVYRRQSGGTTASGNYEAGERASAGETSRNVGEWDQRGRLSEGTGEVRRYSERRATAPSLRETLLAMEETPDMTATEKELLAKYKKLVAEYRELEGQVEAQRTLAEEAEKKYKEQNITATRDEYLREKNRLDVLQSKLRRLGNELYHAEKRTGFGALMARYRLMVQAFNAGRSREQAAERLQARLEEVKRLLETEDLSQDVMSDVELKKILKNVVAQGKLAKVAEDLKRRHMTVMSQEDIQNRIAYLLIMQLEVDEGRSEEERVNAYIRSLTDFAEELTELEPSDSMRGPTLMARLMLETESASLVYYETRGILKKIDAEKTGEEATIEDIQKAARDLLAAKKTKYYVTDEVARTREDAKKAARYYQRLETQRRLTAERENLQQMNDLLKGKVKDWFAERELMEERRRLMDGIRRKVHWMDIRIRRETDQRRIPEGLKPVVEEAVRIFGATNDQLRVFSAKELEGILRTYEKLKDVHGTDLHRMDDILRTYEKLKGVHGTDLHRMDDIVEADLEDALENLRKMTETFARTAEIGDRLERIRQRVTVMQEISEVMDMIRHAIDYADSVVIKGQKKSLQAVTQRLSEDLGSRKDYSINAAVGKVWEQVKEHARNGNLTPPMFFRLIGSSVLTELNDSLMSAQGKHARLFNVAKARLAEIKKAHNYYAWQNNAELEMTTWQGGEKHQIQLTPEEALSIWVTWKREHSDSDLLVHSQHLEEGGFNLARKERKVGKRIVYDGTPHKLSQKDFETIDAWLTDEMKAYAEDIVKYLSTDMAELGNEVSMQLFGIRKFTEAYYFPMKVKPEQLEVSSSKGAKDPGESNRVAHFGGTKRRVDQAKKALVIGGITEVAAQHINEMLLYNTFAIPIESFNKVLNQTYFEGEPLTDEERKEGSKPDPASRMTMRGLFKQKMGDDLAKYLQTYIADLNGGLSQDGRDKGMADRFLSLYKRSAVMASLSVAIQQPSAIVRAMYLVKFKYFLPILQNKDGVNINITKEWAQLTKYSNTALVKERGGFDMTSGRGLTEQLMGNEGDDFDFMQRQLAKVGVGFQGNAKQKAQGAVRAWENAAGFLPGFMDQVTWTMMWRVVKAEVADKNRGMDKSSEAFLQMAAKRFDEVMNLTQVYDSTLVRSHNMRSKSFGKKMLTAFMAESTVTANMLLDAAATKQPKMIGRAAVVFLVQAVFNAALKALWTAFRDEDEEKAWVEKYLSATGNQLGGWSGALNPVALIPGLKDLMALADGYDVERPDMAVWGDLVTEYKRYRSGYYDNRPAADMVQNIGGAVANLFGIPFKNVMRDVRTGVNALEQIFGPNRETTWLGLAHDASHNFVLARDRDNAYYYTRLYEGLASGDKQDVEDVREFLGVLGKSETTIDKGIRGVVKDKFLAGELTEEEAMGFLVKHGLADDDKEAYKYVDNWREAPAHEDEEGYTYSQYNNVYEAINAGDMPGINTAVKELKEHGFLEDKGTLKSTLRGKYRDMYRSLYKTNKTQFANLQAALVTALVAAGVPRSEALEYVKGWLKDTEADKAKENKDK